MCYSVGGSKSSWLVCIVWRCGNIWITPHAFCSYIHFKREKRKKNIQTGHPYMYVVFNSNTSRNDLLNKSNKNLCNESSSVIAQAQAVEFFSGISITFSLSHTHFWQAFFSLFDEFICLARRIRNEQRINTIN